METPQGRRAWAAVAAGLTETLATAAFLGSVAEFPHLANQQPDLYRAFIEQCWRHSSGRGMTSLIHPRSHFTEAKAAPLRRAAYLRLRRNWNITNKLGLFDINRDEKNFDVAIYGSQRSEPDFIMASSVHHPRVIIESLIHDGSGPLPAFRDDNGNWDLRPHAGRVTRIDLKRLKVWHSILEDTDTPILDARMVYSVNSNAANTLSQLSILPRIDNLKMLYSRGWDESIDKKKGYFDSHWSIPDTWDDVILQGPHIGVSSPMIKEPNPTLKNNQDWSPTDYTSMSEDHIPATAYEINHTAGKDAVQAYGSFTINEKTSPSSDFYRIAWRRMAANTGYRTLYPAIIPPGAKHVSTIVSAVSGHGNNSTVAAGAFMSSLASDFYLRAMGIGDIYGNIVDKLPFCKNGKFHDEIIRAYLRLNCLTDAYAPLWKELQGEEWSPKVPIRDQKQRRITQDNIDLMVAERLGLERLDLVEIYRTQFPVMKNYDAKSEYIPKWSGK